MSIIIIVFFHQLVYMRVFNIPTPVQVPAIEIDRVTDDVGFPQTNFQSVMKHFA